MVRSSFVLLIALGIGACKGVSEREVVAGIRAVATLDTVPPFAARVSWPVLQAIYKDRDYQPLWVNGRKPSAKARDLVDAIAKADEEGLRMRDYPLTDLRDALYRAYEADDTRASEVAEVDLRLTVLYLSFGEDLIAGRLDPSLIDGTWYIKTRHTIADSALRQAATEANFDEIMRDLRPEAPAYLALLKELKTYRTVAESGGWGTIDGKAFGVTERGSRVEQLRKRLAATDDLAGNADGETWDDGLSSALTRFRVRHGLPDTTGLDRETLAALNVPVTERIRTIELNLDRLRWLPPAFGERYVMVNIPDFQLHAFNGGKEVLTMPVVVGKEYENATPIFADTMSTVVFGPEWNVPSSIMTNEIVPKVRDDKAYLARNNYEVVDAKSGEVVDSRDVKWDDEETLTKYRIRQRSGDNNALGRVKFLFPNQFAIYMHDTPAQRTFKLRERAESHGCVRLAEPEQFAEYVLGPQDWSRAKIDNAMNTATTLQVPVKPAIPVYLVYLTAFERDGVVHFRDDIYGNDRKAIARMDKADSSATLQAVSEMLKDLMKG